MMPGFKASTWLYTSGPTVVLDNLIKLMSTTSCLSIINDIKKKGLSDPETIIKKEFIHKSVISGWGQ